MSESCAPWGPIFEPDPCIVVTLPGGLELHAGPPKRGDLLTLDQWEGWAGGPEFDGGRVPWEVADGGFRGDVWARGRNLMFRGLILADSPEEFAETQEQLSSVLTRARWGTLRVDEDHLGLARQMTVARTGPASINQLTDRTGQYAIGFQSADPWRLSVDAVSVEIGASSPLQNLGNQDAAVSVQLVGPLTDPGISWPGGYWRYSGTVASGRTISVDMERRVVRDPATAIHSRNRAAGTWLSLPPGTTTVSRTGTGSGVVRLTWRHTWS